MCAEAGGRQGRLINEHRIHFKMKLILCSSVLSLITLTGTDWFNSHDNLAFHDYTTLLLAAGGAGAGGGREKEGPKGEGLDSFSPEDFRRDGMTPNKLNGIITLMICNRSKSSLMSVSKICFFFILACFCLQRD